MDPREYRDARWHSLLREAADLGVSEDAAPALVARVLAEERRRIRRSEDPDPEVRQALADAILGPPARTPRRGRWPAAAALVATVAVAGAVIASTRPQPPPDDHLRTDQMPSLFGYDGAAATALLEHRGLEVRQQPFRSCEVLDRVVGSEPPAGATVDRDDRVVVYTAVPADVSCLTDYGDRELAWQLLDWANGRADAPPFAPRVWVYADDAQRQVLTGDAADPDAWEGTGALAALRDASSDVALVQEYPLTYAAPAVRIIAPTDGLGQCGVPDPSVAGTADVVAFIVRSADRTGCPLRVEVYRDPQRRIESVALYGASS